MRNATGEPAAIACVAMSNLPTHLLGFYSTASSIASPIAPSSMAAPGDTARHTNPRSPYGAGNLALHVGDDPHAVRANRARLAQLPSAFKIQWLEQVHSNRCVYVTTDTVLATPAADAMWTDQPGLGLAIMTADCVPVLVWSESNSDPDERRLPGTALDISNIGPTRVGAAHAGWQGLRDGVISHLVEAMQAGLPEGQILRATIGPCICATHYEVGADVWAQFQIAFSAQMHEHPSDKSKRLLDLAGIARQQLLQCGVELVQRSQRCTYAAALLPANRVDHEAAEPNELYSYRWARQRGWAETGRFATVIGLR